MQIMDNYSMHGHKGSVSTVASTIMPVASDASALTSVTPSPKEATESDAIPIELKVPLPPSSSCSDHDPIRSNNAEDKNMESNSTGRDSSGEGGPVPRDSEEALASLDSGLSSGTMVKVLSVSLQELSALIAQEQYERFQANETQSQLAQQSFCSGLSRRLLSTYGVAYCNMIDQYKSDDQKGFVGLYDACEQLVASFDLQSPWSAPRSPLQRYLSGPEDQLKSRRSYLQRLSLEDQAHLAKFLTRIRTDPSYLPNLISSLNSDELTALTSSYHPAGIELSVLPNHSHGKTDLYSRDSQIIKLSRRIDSLKRVHNQDPYFVLLYGVFDNASRLGSLEYYRRTEIWAKTCAKVVSDAKIGSEEFTIATIDAFAGFQDWPLKAKIEIYLLKTLAEGSFLLEPPSKQFGDPKAPFETLNASHAVATANFFDNTLRDLFKILGSSPPRDAIPGSVLDLIHATLREIQDPSTRILAKKFIVSRWYFASFLSSVLIYPEVQGIMMTHHIGRSARHDILKELVVRMQTQVFNVLSPWNNHTIVTPEVQDQVSKIIEYFEPIYTSDITLDPLSSLGLESQITEQYLMLSHWDIIGLVEGLHPDSSSFPLDKQVARTEAEIHSIASSATLQPGNSDFGSSTAPSTAPSYTGTTRTSDTVFSDTIGSVDQNAPKESLETFNGSSHHLSRVFDFNIPTHQSHHLQEICGKLKDMAKKDQGSGPALSPDEWTLLKVSKDGSDLDLNSKSSGVDEPGPLTMHEDMDAQDLHISPRDHYLLRASIVRLLDPNNGPDIGQLPSIGPANAKSLPMVISNSLRDATLHAQSQYKYDVAHQFLTASKIYNVVAKSDAEGVLSHKLLEDISKELQANIEGSKEKLQSFTASLHSLRYQEAKYKLALLKSEEQRKALRIKMWYVSDVRHSSTYEEALLVTGALRAMANPKRAKQAGSISHWARQRLRGHSTNDRAEAQTLEAMSASREHGGLAKLADEQVDTTSRWLTKNSVENFCKGEERIHRFCHEIQRSIGKLVGPSLLETPVLWSSNLFKREKSYFDTSPSRPGVIGSPHLGLNFSFDHAGARFPPGGSPISPYLSPPGLRPSPNLESSGNFHSSAHVYRSPIDPGASSDWRQSSWPSRTFAPMTPPLTPLSPNFTSNPRNLQENNSKVQAIAKGAFVDQLKKSLCSLMTSDLGYLLWVHGSETDQWVNNAIATRADRDESAAISQEKIWQASDENASTLEHRDHISSYSQNISSIQQNQNPKSNVATVADESPEFPFSAAYTTLLERLSLSYDPYVKLQTLSELESLVLLSISDPTALPQSGVQNAPRQDATKQSIYTVNHSTSIPRTKATCLEEVIANCTERRAGTVRAGASTSQDPSRVVNDRRDQSDLTGSGDTVNALLSILVDTALRPSTLFRDLQFVAAFVSPSILDHTAQGKAFWEVCLAALALKEDLCAFTSAQANEITNYHITAKKPPPSLDTNLATYLANTTLRDAAHLWLTAAKEGSPVAARELGLFYLTNPDILPRVTMPFSKAKDVFKSAAPIDRSGGDKEKGALDPLTFAVVLHWMELAANGGDRDAKDFLRGKGGLGGMV